MDKCGWEKCGNLVTAQHRRIDGIPHCPKHYEMRLTQRFQDSLKNWTGEALPERFLYNWSRYIDEVVYRDQSMPSMLSKSRLRDRTFNHKKVDDSLSFSIIRHPGAFKRGMVTKEVQQNWRFRIDTGELILDSEGGDNFEG